jgi:signal transduction histidine kinase
MSRILHIEDDAINRLLVRKLLVAAGHDVVDAIDGLEGVRLACSNKPDLVLVDLDIPGLDGYEVTLRLRGEASLRDVPIVAITAEGDRDESLAVGCSGFIQKPIDARSFASMVSRYLRGVREKTTASEDGLLRERSQRIVGHLEEKIAELSSANTRLRELGAARTEFYRNISHELATPLTPIVGYVKLLLDEELGPLEPAQVKALSAVEGCVKRLRATLDNLLDVTGLETNRMRFAHREYDFLDTARRALAQLADRFAERSQTLLEELPRGPLPAYGDPERLQRAMVQLLENASKFSPERGHVGVRVLSRETSYELWVLDSGPGIPAGREERIFDPFYQVDGSVTREHGGVGVGLAIARRTARGHGGDVRLSTGENDSIEGVHLGGASFVMSVLHRAPNESTE